MQRVRSAIRSQTSVWYLGCKSLEVRLSHANLSSLRKRIHPARQHTRVFQFVNIVPNSPLPCLTTAQNAVAPRHNQIPAHESRGTISMEIALRSRFRLPACRFQATHSLTPMTIMMCVCLDDKSGSPENSDGIPQNRGCLSIFLFCPITRAKSTSFFG